MVVATGIWWLGIMFIDRHMICGTQVDHDVPPCYHNEMHVHLLANHACM